MSSKHWLGTAYRSSPNPAQTSGRETPGTLLVIVEAPALRKSLRDLLQSYDYLCLTAESLVTAQTLIKRQAVDLVIVDLPKNRNGDTALLQLAQQQPRLPFLALSNQSYCDLAEHPVMTERLHLLTKPVAPSHLLQRVETLSHSRRLEAALHRMQRQLQDSEQRHRFFVNNSPDIIYMLDDQGCFVFVNERATSLLGYPPDSLLGRHYTELVHADDHERVRFAFAERRTGHRATQGLECRLLPCNAANESPDHRRLPIPIELSAMGIYADQAEGERSFIGTYGVARDISARKQAEAQLQFQLSHDLLTRLPNRSLFRDRLELAIAQATRNKDGLAVLYLDLDRFKVINDSLGHQVGDQLLQSVAQRVKACLRESDTLARVGGDEFNLLLPGVRSEEDAALTANKILKALETPIDLEGVEIFTSCSIGIALYPRDGDNLDLLVRHADTAMYQVKKRGKNSYQFYDAGMKSLHSRHLTLENGLRRALKEDELRLYFQPQMDAASGEITGVEALMRWQHPDQGLVLPAEFIPLSEESGLITDMGRWALDHACQVLAEWNSFGLRDLTLAVNVSSRELLQSDFNRYVLRTLAHYHVDPRQLELEITENVLMQDMDQAVTKLRDLADQGVRIAVDDFGTGYSSLSYLQRLPLDTLKVDRTFIGSIHSPQERNAIVTAIVAMARGLDLNLIAEGVESDTQLQYLRQLGCPKVQGYLIGHPQPANQLLKKLIA